MRTTILQSQAIPDPIQAGLASGWKVIDAATLEADQQYEADVAIVGTGAGGGVTAEMLARAGLRVLLIEEGPLKSSRDFKMREAQAYPALYQESAARKTRDMGINIMQGRSVGGSTTVNWTSSFRTPDSTLRFWQQQYGLKEFSTAAMAPWFERMEQRLHIAPWATAPNENNDLLRRGAQKLGIDTAVIPRNVNGCWNLGYCGMGCPTNAKQSMLVTTIPSALSQGAVLLTRTRAEHLQFKGDQVEALACVAMAQDGLAPTGRRVMVRARHYVLSGGAINTPALLLRSGAPDPSGQLGKRTFLHPVVLSVAQYVQEVNPFAGAPQSVYSDHFLKTVPIDGPLGYKLEVPPLHPLLLSATVGGFGEQHARIMRQLPHMQMTLALLRDGFHPQSQGGVVQLRDDGSPVLDYPLNEVLWDGARRALLSMAEIQFAAGAQSVYPVHEMAQAYTSWSAARQAIHALPLAPLLTRVVSAHVMGGCALAADEKQGVVSPQGRYYGLRNLSVHDGSLFPTSIGANPQLSIYGLTCRLSEGLALSLKA